MKTIVCDASPLIFLAKLNRLDLLHRVLDGEIFVLRCVVDEVLTDSAGLVERKRLDAFFASIEVVDFTATGESGGALSRSDHSTLLWAIENGGDWLLADERLLRRVATEEGIAMIGFLGILLLAARRKILPVIEVRHDINACVSRHGCRISVALYQRLISELDTLASEG
jgi:predicted nucleic acid-binding protein